MIVSTKVRQKPFKNTRPSNKGHVRVNVERTKIKTTA